MDAVEEVKQRLSIEDVVSEYVQLKRAGRNWKGLSPFTNERTPSFTVSPEKQIWHDFSSGKGGDMFSFVMAMEGLDFKGALELLARKAGVDLEQYRTIGKGKGGPDKERLYQALELATKFYQTQLSGSQLAIDYVFKKRQFTKDTALTWKLGYAPNTGRALVEFLGKQGFKEQEIKLAGLTNRFGGDMFRERLMIPLADPQGRVVGFTARQLVDEKNSPKYINTPSTPLYDKSRHVYGLHLAKEAIRKEKFVVMAEGNLDVIMSHQAGVKQVVATAGTALTEPHLKALSRFTGDIRLSFDADNAGINATERAIPIASKVKVSLSIITIPSGKDPDELIKQDVSIWKDIITKPQYALDWLMERYQNMLDITSAEGKRKFSDVLLPVVKELADPVEQDHYINAISKVAGIGKEALITKMEYGEQQNVQPKKKPRPPVTEPDATPFDPTYTKNVDNFMSLMLMQPGLRTFLHSLPDEAIPSGDGKTLADFLRTHTDFSGAGDERASELNNLADYVKILALYYEEIYQDVEYVDLSRAAATLQQKIIRAYVGKRKQDIQQVINDADEDMQQRLLRESVELDQLLAKSKGAF